MGLPYQKGDFLTDDIGEYELKFEDEAIKFNENSKYINIYIFSAGALQEAFTSDLSGDLAMVG